MAFVDVTEEDFGTPAPAGTNPATGKPFTTREVFETVVPPTPPSNAMEIEPSAGKRFLAALGGNLQEPVLGLKEKLQLTFPGKGQADAMASQVAADRAQRRKALGELEATPAGMVGGIVGKGLPLVAAQNPAAVAGIAGGLGFLGGGPDQPSGLFEETTGSLGSGIKEGVMGWVPAKALQLAGKTAGAATGQLTKEGARAKEIEAAAARLGLPRPSFGQTYPQSGISTFERASPEFNALVNEQAEALYKAITKDTPYGVPEVGGKYLDELRAAVANRYKAGGDMYRKVDEIVNQKGLGKFMPGYTANVVTNVNNPGYQIAAEELGKYGFDVASMAGMQVKALRNIPLRFEDFNTMRVATNKAWGNLNRQIESAKYAGNAPATELKAAKQYLDDLRTALDSDAERWAKVNVDNREAVSAYRDATKYWKEQVVPTVVENPFARKVASSTRGFPTGESATRLSLSTANTPLVDRLLPTMSSRGADITEILRTLPEVRATALTGETAQMPRGPLRAFAQAAEGQRDIGTLEKLAANLPVLAPGLRWVANRTPTRRLYGARDIVTGNRAARIPAYGFGVPLASERAQESIEESLTK